MANNEGKTEVKSSTSTMNNSIVGTEAAIRSYYMPEFDPNKDNFEVWMERLEIHFIELECENDETAKRNTLLKSMGSEAYGVVRSLCDPKLPKDTEFNDLVEYLKKYYLPTVIIFSERKKFYDAKKTDGESVTAWFTRVKKLAGKCKFGTNLDAFVLDKFVCGLPGIIFERLCEEDEKLTAANALKKALIVESKLTVKSNDTECEVNWVKKHRSKSNYNNKSKENNASNRDNEEKKEECKHCGWRNHPSESCRYKTARCHRCSSIGHISSVCRVQEKEKEVNFIKNNDFFSNSQNFSNNNFVTKSNAIDYSQCETEEQFGVYMMEEENEEANGSTDVYHGSRVYVLPVGIDGVELSVACDTGAPLSLMSIGMFDKLYNRSQLKHCKLKFTNYSGNRIPIVGEFFANVTYRGQSKKISFVVTDTKTPPLLSRNFLRKFNFELKQTNINVNTVEFNDKITEIFENKNKEKEREPLSLIESNCLDAKEKIISEIEMNDTGNQLILNEKSRKFSNLNSDGIIVEEPKINILRANLNKLIKEGLKFNSCKNVKKFRSILNKINYYSKFICEISDKFYDKNFDWNDFFQNEATKTDTFSDQNLIPFKSNSSLILENDSSQNAIASVLSQQFSDNSKRTIAFKSHSLSSTTNDVIENNSSKIFFNKKNKPENFDKINNQIFATILESQHKSKKNFENNREIQINIDDNVIIRDNSDPNKPIEIKTKISEIIGPRSNRSKYIHSGKMIESHLNKNVDNESNANVDTEIELCSASGAAVTKRDSTAPMDATAIVDETMKDDTSLPKKAKKPKRTAHRMKLRSRKNNKNINK